MGWGRYDDDWGYPKSSPRKAEGGIKAQSKRGNFGESWWAKRWIAVLDSFHIGARLTRGRSYARSGQVLSIEIQKGRVFARVQGSRPKPYNVTIEMKTLSSGDWKKLARALAGQAIHAAKLLAGEMPPDVEDVFRECRLSLFPTKLDDLDMECSCPDWSNPCKHIAAVFYLLGEEFDRDPFLIFTLRGLNRDELLGLLGEEGTSASAAATVPAPAQPAAIPEPLAADPARFWAVGDLDEDPFGEVAIPNVPAALPRRLRGFPLWRGSEPFLEAIEPTYTAASPRGLDAFMGQDPDGPASSRP